MKKGLFDNVFEGGNDYGCEGAYVLVVFIVGTGLRIVDVNNEDGIGVNAPCWYCVWAVLVEYSDSQQLEVEVKGKSPTTYHTA